ncbi:mechanosensitive ion channel family protein [Algoriphagus sediminis]|uniref:Mechanosensitive ion channel family protein n=1 Tax=Algoriphagus sediminis TaxID=3057113 RepID=A0ABT7YFC9_9BACT|nr:mechanosensitive ion channel family protein [Algoriphagus sediminis]MDN3205233.1 mechanosensitive ion channel family protein [Algoriphagus sediminis]
MTFDLKEALNVAVSKIEGWLESFAAMVPNMIVAAITFSLFFLLARYSKKFTARLFQKFSNKSALNTLATTIFQFLILAGGLIVVLNILELEKTVTSLLAGAGIIGLALGFAFQDIASNFMSGVAMAIRQPIKVGDIVETNDFMGEVEKIDLRVTTVRTFQGIHVLIPNKEVFQNPLMNYTKTPERRIDLSVGVSYADDLEKVKEVAEKAIRELPFLLPDREVNLFYREFGDSSINFQIMFWIQYPGQTGYLKATSDSIMAIKKAFDNNDITIPFPIRTLDFGIKGGEKLSDMKVNIINKELITS